MILLAARPRLVGGCFKITDSFVGVELNWSLVNPTPFQLVFLSAHHVEGGGSCFPYDTRQEKQGAFLGMKRVL